MTTPSDNTPYAILEDAYSDAGKLSAGETLNGDQITKGMRRLRDLVNTYQTQGLKLWLNSLYTLTLTEGTATYTFGPAGSVVMTKPLRVIMATYVNDDVSRTLTPLSWNDYLSLSNRAQEGAVTSYFVNKQQTTMNVSLWQVPDATAAEGTVQLLLQQQVTDPISLTETMNFPVEWRMALHWGLAAELSTGQPQAVIDRCEGKAQTYRKMLEDWDVEDAETRFTPDPRFNMGSRFR